MRILGVGQAPEEGARARGAGTGSARAGGAREAWRSREAAGEAAEEQPGEGEESSGARRLDDRPRGAADEDGGRRLSSRPIICSSPGCRRLALSWRCRAARSVPIAAGGDGAGDRGDPAGDVPPFIAATWRAKTSRRQRARARGSNPNGAWVLEPRESATPALAAWRANGRRGRPADLQTAGALRTSPRQIPQSRPRPSPGARPAEGRSLRALVRVGLQYSHRRPAERRPRLTRETNQTAPSPTA